MGRSWSRRKMNWRRKAMSRIVWKRWGSRRGWRRSWSRMRKRRVLGAGEEGVGVELGGKEVGA